MLGWGEAYWKQFIWWEKEKVCSGIVLNSIFRKDTLKQFVEKWRAKVRGNNLGERWEESIYRRLFGNKVGKSWWTRGRGIMGVGFYMVQKVRCKYKLPQTPGTGRWKGLGRFSELKRTLTKISSTQLPGKNIRVQRKVESPAGVLPASLPEWFPKKTINTCHLHGAQYYSSFLFTLRVYGNAYNSESLQSLIKWTWQETFQ